MVALGVVAPGVVVPGVLDLVTRRRCGLLLANEMPKKEGKQDKCKSVLHHNNDIYCSLFIITRVCNHIAVVFVLRIVSSQ